MYKKSYNWHLKICQSIVMCHSNLKNMKIRNFFISLLALALVLGCEDDVESGSEGFGEVTTEQHKQNIEESGLNVVSQMNEMGNMEAVHTIIDFIEVMNATSQSESDLVMMLQPVASVANGSEAAFNLKSTTSEPESFSQLFYNEAGIYEYNASLQSWEKTGETTDEITYKFPTAASQTNNAIITLNNFSYISSADPYVDQLTEELLRSVDLKLSVDNIDLMSIELRAGYDNGIPDFISEDIVIEDYIISTSFSRSTSKIEINQSFSFKEQNILSLHFSNAGNFDYTNIEDSAYDQETDIENQDVADNSNLRVVVDNIKVEGFVNWKILGEEISKQDDSLSEQAYAESMADVLNNSSGLDVMYNNTNKIFATSEFYAFEADYDYWNEPTWEYGIRMKFEDDSFMDESFFSEENFSNLIEDAEELFSDMESNYGQNN